MISQSELTSWFKTLESYKRIDTMCTLLNICLPFELRFLGTCLEELGRRDSQELRGMELRVNNPVDLAADMSACQQGEPTDIKIRRKMALYLALIRVCNRTCVNEIFQTLEAWGELDFSSMNDADTLQELLLVYTMAANHPVFDFQQHMKCTQIFEKIKENRLVAETPEPPPSPVTAFTTNLLTTANIGIPPPHNLHMLQPIGGHLDMGMGPPLIHQPSSLTMVPNSSELIHGTPMHNTVQHPQMLAASPIQMLPQSNLPLNYPQGHLTKVINDLHLTLIIFAVIKYCFYKIVYWWSWWTSSRYSNWSHRWW